jgi:hypothetical protein
MLKVDLATAYTAGSTELTYISDPAHETFLALVVDLGLQNLRDGLSFRGHVAVQRSGKHGPRDPDRDTYEP